MHEMKVASEIIIFSEKEMRERGFRQLNEIGIKIGALSCVDPGSLRFAFDVLKKETALSDAELKIEHVSIEAVCESCEKSFTIDDFVFVCPHCGSNEVRTIKGDELLITYLIGD